ncbi:MAG TPA: hypothetical protein VFS24_06600 [Steroidobacteraceae bacterium]|nr:hypothetical protein [Steroidobacteraceae bacterium]
MKASSGQRFLVLYSGALTLAVCVALLSGFADLHGPRFDTITVQRINIVEPDGTLRMVLSNNSRIPAVVMHGKEYPDFGGRKPSTAAGILFYDAEGSESGGLTFGGRKDAQGAITRFGHLSFDRYDQDQMFTIDAVDDGTNHRSAIQMIDQPNWSIVDYLELRQRIQNLPEAEQQAQLEEFFNTHPTDGAGVRTKLSNENYPDAPASSRNALHFFDRTNAERLEAGLDNNSDPALEIRDQNGNLVQRVPPAQ